MSLGGKIMMSLAIILCPCLISALLRLSLLQAVCICVTWIIVTDLHENCYGHFLRCGSHIQNEFIIGRQLVCGLCQNIPRVTLLTTLAQVPNISSTNVTSEESEQ